MRDLNYDLKQLCRSAGTTATAAMPPKRNREHILDLVADQLHQMGFRHMNAHSLRPKHVEKLIELAGRGALAGDHQEPDVGP